MGSELHLTSSQRDWIQISSAHIRRMEEAQSCVNSCVHQHRTRETRCDWRDGWMDEATHIVLMIRKRKRLHNVHVSSPSCSLFEGHQIQGDRDTEPMAAGV